MTNTEGAYVRSEWVPLLTARQMAAPDDNGPGVYSRDAWVPLTCRICTRPATRCEHHRPTR